MSHLLHKTELTDRVLYYDGDSVATPEHLLSLINQGLNPEGLFVTEETNEIKQFNALVSSDKRITNKTDVRPLSYDWNIPSPYKTWTEQDVVDHIIDCWAAECVRDTSITSEDSDVRMYRVSSEITLYKKLNLISVLRTIIYVINTLRENKIVWGVGRGSSVSSYVLYLIGAHDVDSVKYDLDFNEFLRAPAPTTTQEI